MWSSVVSKKEHHQSHFNLRKFLLGFFILQKQWDPNFLVVCISFLLCTTVPFFLVVFFPSLCKYHNWCLCQNTNTNYDPKKLRPPQKRYSRLAGYVFRTTRKITTPPKKRYSRLTDGWNKSQITVCRVEIRTHQLQLEKIMTGKKVRHSRLVVCCVKIQTPPITL